VTWLSPNLRVTGLSPFLFFLSLASSLAVLLSLSAFCFLVSGEYFLKILINWEVVALSKGLKNWAIEGGTFNLLNRILFFLWIWTYLGHLTNLALTILGLIAFPNLLFLGAGWVKGCFSVNFLIWDWVKIVPFLVFFTYLKKLNHYLYHWKI